MDNMWVARDIDNQLWIYRYKPIRKGNLWIPVNQNDNEWCVIKEEGTLMFKDIKWDDKEPTEIKLIRK